MDRLDIASRLFGALDAARIDYVHWKSNEHLAAAINGETDLDLLISSEHDRRFDAVVKDLGFVEIRSPRARYIKGLTGYLGCDDPSQKLLHLDVHYRLILGDRLVKNTHLPLEDWMLDGSGELHGVRVPSPAKEFLILYIRVMLKTTARQLLRGALRAESPLPERIQREASWLAARVDEAEAVDAASTCGLGIAAAELVEFRSRSVQDRLDWLYVAERKRSLGKRLRSYERSPRLSASSRRALLRIRGTQSMRRLGFGIGRRRLVREAPIVAVVGADGAGKTRLTGDLAAWLGTKLAVRHVYFGQPKTGFGFRLLRRGGRLARQSMRAGQPQGIPPAWPVLVRLSQYIDDAKWVVLARRRRRLARAAVAARHSGEVVVAERFPLEDFHSMATPMDGPRLTGVGHSGSHLLGPLEARSYASIEAPDLVLALDTTVDTLRGRKVDLTLEETAAKAAAVQALEQGPGVVVIDAGSVYEHMLAEAKTAVWGAIRAHS